MMSRKNKENLIVVLFAILSLPFIIIDELLKIAK